MNSLNSSREIFNYIKEKLNPVYGPDEAQSLSFIILKELLSISKIDFLANKSIPLPCENISKILNSTIERLAKHEPIQHIIGHTEFYNCKITVNQSVLIPRPETEELVDLIIKENASHTNLTILDICTGSGCIPIALSKNLSVSDIFAIDISEAAIEVAEKNAVLNNVSIHFFLRDVMQEDTPLEIKSLDVIVSNPPYVMESEKVVMQKNVLEYEPHIALFVEDLDPLVFYKRISELSKKGLKVGGRLYFEINEKFGQEVRNVMKSHSFTDIKIVKDIFGKDRFVIGKLSAF